MDKILSLIVSFMNIVTIRRDAAVDRIERGASTLELVIISAGLLGVAIVVTVLITNVVNSRSAGIF